jgi:hypothetical protein
MRIHLRNVRRRDVQNLGAPPPDARRPLSHEEQRSFRTIALGVESFDQLSRWCAATYENVRVSPYPLGGLVGLVGSVRYLWAAYGPDEFAALARAVLAAEAERGPRVIVQNDSGIECTEG